MLHIDYTARVHVYLKKKKVTEVLNEYVEGKRACGSWVITLYESELLICN